jgi:hypothetical protein
LLGVEKCNKKYLSHFHHLKVMTGFQVKQSNPPSSDGLVGIHHKLVNHWCALEDWANKKKKKVLGQC